jgi:hypothetical protein
MKILFVMFLLNENTITRIAQHMESKTEIHVKSFDSILKLIAAKHARS